MTGRFNHRFRIIVYAITGLGLCPAVVSADIDTWYELIDSTGPGAGVVNVQQGQAGAPLIIETDGEPGEYDLTIRFVADIDSSESLVSYAVDLVAPNEETISALSLSPSGSFDVEGFATLGTGPGTIVENASEFNILGTPVEGVVGLFEVVLQLSEPPAGDIEIFSGIGALEWATSSGSPVNVIFADADPLEGTAGEIVSSTPSIIIRQGEAPQGDDCDGDNTPDADQIAADPSLDCNGNDTLDSCEIADGTAPDCNQNSVPDECDLSSGTSPDCDGNSVPDECDIADGTAADCNSNSVPDACDITGGTSQDCNSNSIPDECDIAAGTSMDADGDGVPDECPDTPGGNPIENPVRTLLAIALDVPSDGWPMMSSIPLALFGVLGIPMSVSLFFVELLNLPVRVILFELLAALFGAGSA
ncbi:MAG: hypothetical protein MI923_04395 [Phycisphaerales bacterium]|nr:hypothetical protein [Phycisphaerales bacterium]